MSGTRLERRIIRAMKSDACSSSPCGELHISLASRHLVASERPKRARNASLKAFHDVLSDLGKFSKKSPSASLSRIPTKSILSLLSSCL